MKSDKLVNLLLQDRKARKQFLENPTKLLIDRGFASRKLKPKISLANKLLLSLLTDREMRRLLSRITPKVAVTQEELNKILDNVRRTGNFVVSDELKLKMFRTVATEKFILKVLPILLKDKFARQCFPPQVRRLSPSELDQHFRSAFRNVKSAEDIDRLIETEFAPWAVLIAAVAVAVFAAVALWVAAAVDYVVYQRTVAISQSSAWTSGPPPPPPTPEYGTLNENQVAFIMNLALFADGMQTLIEQTAGRHGR